MRRPGSSFGSRLVLPACLCLTAALGGNMLFLQGGKNPAGAVTPVAEAPASRAKPERSKLARGDEIAMLLQASEPAKVPSRKTARIAPADPKLVIALQRELAAAGYQAGGETGVTDLMTRGAILAYEHDHRLPLTAEPSTTVLNGLLTGGAASAGQKPAANAPATASPQALALITKTQSMLRKLGYRTGVEDGAVTDQTGRAIRQFETASGLPATGRVSGALLAELARMSGTRLDMASSDIAE